MSNGSGAGETICPAVFILEKYIVKIIIQRYYGIMGGEAYGYDLLWGTEARGGGDRGV